MKCIVQTQVSVINNPLFTLTTRSIIFVYKVMRPIQMAERSKVDRLMGLRLRIPPEARMSDSFH